MENARAPINTNTSIPSQSQHVTVAKQQTPSPTQVIETRPTDFEIGVPVATGVLTIATMGQSELQHKDQKKRAHADECYSLAKDMGGGGLTNSAYIKRGRDLNLTDHQILQHFEDWRVIEDAHQYCIRYGDLVKKENTASSVNAPTPTIQSVEPSKPTPSDSSRFASVSTNYKQVVGVSPKPRSLPEISSQQNFLPFLNGLLITLGALSASYLSSIGISFLKTKRRETLISKEFFENGVVRKMIRENIHPVKFQVLKENFTALRLGNISTEIFEETLRESLGFNKEEINSFYI